MLYSNDQKQQRDSTTIKPAVSDAQNVGASQANLIQAEIVKLDLPTTSQETSQRRQSLELPATRAAAASSITQKQRNGSSNNLQDFSKTATPQQQEIAAQQSEAVSQSQQQVPSNIISLNEQLVNAVNNNAAKRNIIQSSKSPRRQAQQAASANAPANGSTPKRAITASNYQTTKQSQDQDNTSSASAPKQNLSGSGKGNKNAATAGTQQRNKVKKQVGNEAGKGSAGNQRKQTAGEIKLLSSQQNTNKGQSNRSNSISRRSAASNSSMAVTQAIDGDIKPQKKGKSVVRPLPRQRANNNQSENKKSEKAAAITVLTKSTPLDKQAAASLEKAKIAEEIKLNVADVAMDLLNNATTAPTKVNNLILSPKSTLITADSALAVDNDGLADDEESPVRQNLKPGDDKEFESQIGLQDNGKISISRIENTEDSEDEETLLDARDETEQDDDDDYARQIKMTALKGLNLPPPLELIAKTVYKEEEPIKTGAPISFVSLAQMAGGRFKNEEVCGKSKEDRQGETEPDFPVDLKPDVATLRANTSNIQHYMASMNENGYVVYCRFGREYIGHLAKQHQLMINNPNLSSHMRQIATYLINIKKLVKDHNIESESKDFNKLKTCGTSKMKKKSEQPPTPFYIPTGPQDKTLIFESRFETGNLLASMKVSDNEYDMVLQNDINTNGHTQWFFFRVSNTRKGQTVKFNILNLAKPDSLYNEGMRVLSFSQLSRDGPEQLSWHRIGENISYHTNTFKREGNRFGRCYFTLTFTHTFTENNDQVYFAHCFPYTYTDLCDDLSRIERDRFSQNFVNRSTLCRTLAGNRCEYITITSKERDPLSAKSQAKKGVFISARVHPGESNASWMMKGVIEFLVSNTAEAHALRENFVFKIVPMLNPDGVINGNYRCSLAGQDLNRRWKIPSKTLHPVNWHVKRMVRDFKREREIALVCDLHGHSRRKNIFMYGNNFENRPHATRVFPFIMSKLLDYFSFEYSRFSVHKSKEATARVTLWRELQIPNVFTMEASFCGANKGLLNNKHFMPEHLMLAGRKLMEGLIVYTKLQVHPLKPSQIAMTAKKPTDNTSGPTIMAMEEEKTTKRYTSIRINEIEQELTTNKQLIEMTKGDEDGEDTAGSDSEPSEDNLSEEEMAKIIPIKRKESPNKNKDKNKKNELNRKNSGKRLKGDESPSARGKIPPQLVPRTNPTRSPIKRIFPYQNPYDRMMRRGLKKVEMVDAWTQTSNRGSDNEDAKKKQGQSQPPQIKHGNLSHQRVMSIGGVAGLDQPIIGSSSSQQARGSVENIYHPQSQDPKSLQLQQDRRLAQIHRQNTQEQNKMGLTQNDRQFSTGKSSYPHTSSQQSTQQLQQSNASPSVMPANQIRIRKDPIKHQPGYKKPPNLAIYEEALLKQTSGGKVTGGSGTGMITAQGSFKAHQGQLHQTMRSNDQPPESMVKLPKNSLHGEVFIAQQVPLIEGRSPGLIKSNNKLSDSRGKTFTATRLGNFPNGKADQQFFHYTGSQQPPSDSSQQQQMRLTKTGPGSNDLMMNNTVNASNKQRVFINNSQFTYGSANGGSKHPDSPSKRLQNYTHSFQQQQQNMVVTTGASSRKASVNQRSPLLSSSFQQSNQQVHSASKSGQNAARDSFHFRAAMGQKADGHHYDQQPIHGSRSQNPHNHHNIPSKTAQVANASGKVKTRNPDLQTVNSGASQQQQQINNNIVTMSSNRQQPDGITTQKLAEFRSNRSTAGQGQNKTNGDFNKV